MKSSAIFQKLTMSTGLIPTIICMFLCIFFPDTAVLYAITLGSILYVLYRYIRFPYHQPNLFLLHGTLALAIVSVIKKIGGNWLIPDNTINITLEILILSFSLLYSITPGFYRNFFSYFHHKVPAMNNWGIYLIISLSGLHLFIFCVTYLFFHPLSATTIYIMEQIIPPLLYIVCILINFSFVEALVQHCKKMPCLRIAPVCDGKVYVVPLQNFEKEAGKFDLPIRSYITDHTADTDSYAKKVEEEYSKFIIGQPEPRFSLKYLTDMEKMILLYVLPLNEEAEICFPKGKFVTPQEIEANPEQYSVLLNEEVSHLSIVAEMWKEYK